MVIFDVVSVMIQCVQFDDDVEGTGMGEGEGKKDVTDQIEDEEQLLGLKGEEPDKDEAEAKELGGSLMFVFTGFEQFLLRSIPAGHGSRGTVSSLHLLSLLTIPPRMLSMSSFMHATYYQAKMNRIMEWRWKMILMARCSTSRR